MADDARIAAEGAVPERAPGAGHEAGETRSGGSRFRLPVALGPLRHRNYRLLWTGTLISQSGDWMDQIALNWLVYDLTGSAFALGLVNLCRLTPILFFTLVGGVIADRVERRKLMFIDPDGGDGAGAGAGRPGLDGPGGAVDGAAGGGRPGDRALVQPAGPPVVDLGPGAARAPLQRHRAQPGDQQPDASPRAGHRRDLDRDDRAWPVRSTSTASASWRCWAGWR